MQLLGCVDTAKQVRQYTYPPDFRYITREELRSTMWQLAYHLRELNQLMRGPDTPEQHRQEIIDQLRAMESAAARLGGWPSNHPLVEMNLPSFRRDIRTAREAVERDPPDFLLAGAITGACVYCHRGR